MCSLTNKQLLLTAYAYLFITEQQKEQQGSDALHLSAVATDSRQAPLSSNVSATGTNYDALTKLPDTGALTELVTLFKQENADEATVRRGHRAIKEFLAAQKLQEEKFPELKELQQHFLAIGEGRKAKLQEVQKLQKWIEPLLKKAAAERRRLDKLSCTKTTFSFPKFWEERGGTRLLAQILGHSDEGQRAKELMVQIFGPQGDFISLLEMGPGKGDQSKPPTVNNLDGNQFKVLTTATICVAVLLLAVVVLVFCFLACRSVCGALRDQISNSNKTQHPVNDRTTRRDQGGPGGDDQV